VVMWTVTACWPGVLNSHLTDGYVWALMLGSPWCQKYYSCVTFAGRHRQPIFVEH